MRRLDIGVSSHNHPQKLQRTLESIQGASVTDYRVFVIHNPGGRDDAECLKVIDELDANDPRVTAVKLRWNLGYAGAVKELQSLAETEYIAYCDNDIHILTQGWDEKLCSYLDRFHEIGMIFPGGGAYQIDRGSYQEIMWGVGCCWVLNRLCMSDTGYFDTTLGHQEEADYALRVRMAGWKCAAAPEVMVQHDATATNDPARIESINRGVVNFVNKWCRYFGGKNLNYHSPNVLRWEDWPPNALYLEEYWKARCNGLNAEPEVRTIDGREYDLIRVPRYKGFYANRII